MRLKKTMKVSLKLNGKPVKEFPKKFVYPFFLFHMAMFGLSGFIIAYATSAPTFFLWMHGGIAIFVYLIFYLIIFGLDAVKWMFINAALGLLGIMSQVDWVLELFNKDLSDFHWTRHITPLMYYVLYTFLIRNLLIDYFKARDDDVKLARINNLYVWGSVLIYGSIAILALLRS